MLFLFRNRLKGLFSIVAVSLLIFSFDPDADAFVIPEVLQYDLTWAGVKAGEATLQIQDSGEELKITSTARSVKWVSVFYTVNDVVESRVRKNQPELLFAQPVHYRLNLREGKHRKDKEVVFDHSRLRALYTDYIDNEKIEFEIPSLTFDSISGFYYFRTMNLEVGKSVYVTVFDNKKVWNVEVQVLRKERVKVPAGEFDTIVVKPLLQSEGIFYRKGEIYIWLTDDKKRVPVLLRSKVKIGSINASLVGGTY